MAVVYSLDLRERIVAAYEEMGNKSAVARRFKVSRWTVADYLKRAQEGQLAPTPHPGRPSRLNQADCEQLRQQVHEHPDWTLEQHADELAARRGVTIKKSTVSNYLRKLGLSHKKRSSTQANVTR